MNIEAKELSKIYGSGESRVVALDKVNLEIASSDFISIMGPSGSGKSTLLHLLSGLDSSSVQDMYFSDYAVTNETLGIPAEAVDTLKANDAVERLSTTRLSFETDLSVQSYETFQLANIDDGLLEIYAPNLSDQDKQALNDGTGCLVKNPIPFSYGDTPYGVHRACCW